MTNQSLDNRILEYLRSNPQSTAREIGTGLGSDKKTINGRLYGSLKGRVSQDEKYRWSLVGDESAAGDNEAPTYPDTSLSKLARYFLACISQDDDGVSVFAQSRYGPDYAELPHLPDQGQDIWTTEQARHMFSKLHKEKSRFTLYLGYPVMLGLQKSRKSDWQGLMVEPVFLFPVTFDENRSPRLDLGFPIVNRKAYRRVTNSSGLQVMEELALLETELGLEGVDVAPDLDDMMHRLVAIREEWPWQEKMDPDSLESNPPISEISEPGLYNRAVLVMVERSPYTQGLESELSSIARLPEGGADGTALGSWISTEFPKNETEGEPVLEVLPMNSEQRNAVESALNRSLTIITGPPGTGKSQVVTNLLINAAWRGQRVLFASKNNKAVDVVEERVNNLGPRPMLLRVGANQYQGRLAEYLVSLMAARSTEEDRVCYDESLERHKRFQEKITGLDQEADAIVAARNSVDALEQKVEELRGEFGVELFSSLRKCDLRLMESTIKDFEVALNGANRSRQNLVVRLFWSFIKRGRYSALEQAANGLQSSDTLLGLKMPLTAPDDGCFNDWQTFGESLSERLVSAREVRTYFDALAELQNRRGLEDISLEHAGLINNMASNAERLWDSWLKLQPERLSAQDRTLINRYSSLLKMVIDSGKDGQLAKNVYRQYYSLFPKVGHLLSCWAVTSLSAKGRIPFEPGYFDLVVFDEASQCDIASALPLLYRAKRAVVIGDPKQLAHISGLVRGQDQQLLERFGLLGEFPHWSYSYQSLFSLASGMAEGPEIIDLRDHHRSHSDIIEFSNREFYGGRLRVATRYSNLNRPAPDAVGVMWVDAEGSVIRPAGGGAYNDGEAAKVVDVLRDLVVQKGYEGSVGVVSPFRSHANRIQQLVNEDRELSSRLINQGFLVDTVHRFQGDERDVMIFSPVVSRGTPETALGFLRANGNLFNVAITRARAQLIVVGDRQACGSSGVAYLENFAKYTSELESKVRSEVKLAAEDLGPRYPDVSNPEQVSEWEHHLYEAMYAAGIRAIPQYRVEKYALDFAVFDKGRKLDIEVDGERYHRNWSGELCRRDQLRNQRLFELGWDVRRFWVYEIRDELDQCVQRIKEWLHQS
jgi:very-short-patch-repair endonuclease